MKLEELKQQLATLIAPLKEEERIEVINELRTVLHELSPFQHEPVDCVLWIASDKMKANDYNPNNVAPIEKQLLFTSLLEDGFTQPVVAAHSESAEKYTIIDGYHRFELGSKRADLRKRLHGYLPVVLMNKGEGKTGNMMASTIRHNRARGRHQINAMAEIVRELANLGWSEDKIGHELGMDADEVLRLKQVNGLFELFGQRKFSQAWTVE
ncbi:MAG TPA: ParB/RepB/Spo0J family partition protein [Buttiauxella sp.]|jgi:ParB-like chromosome segregation protein Spo0J